MNFQPKTHILKTGNSIKVRLAALDDAQKLVNLKRSYLKNTTTIPIKLEEYTGDLDNELRIITEYKASPNGILLVAEYNDELIGNIDLTGSKLSKMFHTGMIGMGIKEAWRNQGLGRILIESVIDWAKEHSPIELIWLDVYASNELGYNLYKNTGFEVSGRINGFFKDENGYKDKIQMYQRIKEKVNVKIYHNRNCSKSNNSCQLLLERGIDFETIEYLKTPLTKEELKELLTKLGIPAIELIRKGETLYKAQFMDKTLSEEEWIEAMVEHPILIQRPIIVKGNKAVIGRPIERVIELVKDQVQPPTNTNNSPSISKLDY